MTTPETTMAQIGRRMLSAKAEQFTESVIREMTRLALKHHAVNLSQGFPDFAAPAAELKTTEQGPADRAVDSPPNSDRDQTALADIGAADSAATIGSGGAQYVSGVGALAVGASIANAANQIVEDGGTASGSQVAAGGQLAGDIQVQNSAQAGAQYATVHSYDSAAISTAVTSATSVSGISAVPAPVQFCGCVDATSKTVTSATCGTTCASDGMNAGTYVTASAQRDYSTLINYPGFAASYHQTASSTVRIK